MSYFSSQNIRLRALESDDLELLFTIENDETYWILSNTIQPFSRDTLKKYLKNAHLDIYTARQLRLVIEHKEKSVGLIDLFDYEPFHKRLGIGILIQSKFQNNGYAGEALELIKKYCFEYLNVHQLYAHIETDNINSLKLFKNNGFEITGTKKDWLRISKKYKDVHFLQCLK